MDCDWRKRQERERENVFSSQLKAFKSRHGSNEQLIIEAMELFTDVSSPPIMPPSLVPYGLSCLSALYCDTLLEWAVNNPLRKRRRCQVPRTALATQATFTVCNAHNLPVEVKELHRQYSCDPRVVLLTVPLSSELVVPALCGLMTAYTTGLEANKEGAVAALDLLGLQLASSGAHSGPEEVKFDYVVLVLGLRRKHAHVATGLAWDVILAAMRGEQVKATALLKLCSSCAALDDFCCEEQLQTLSQWNHDARKKSLQTEQLSQAVAMVHAPNAAADMLNKILRLPQYMEALTAAMKRSKVKINIDNVLAAIGFSGRYGVQPLLVESTCINPAAAAYTADDAAADADIDTAPSGGMASLCNMKIEVSYSNSHTWYEPGSGDVSRRTSMASASDACAEYEAASSSTQSSSRRSTESGSGLATAESGALLEGDDDVRTASEGLRSSRTAGSGSWGRASCALTPIFSRDSSGNGSGTTVGSGSFHEDVRLPHEASSANVSSAALAAVIAGAMQEVLDFLHRLSQVMLPTTSLCEASDQVLTALYDRHKQAIGGMACGRIKDMRELRAHREPLQAALCQLRGIMERCTSDAQQRHGGSSGSSKLSKALSSVARVFTFNKQGRRMKDAHDAAAAAAEDAAARAVLGSITSTVTMCGDGDAHPQPSFCVSRSGYIGNVRLSAKVTQHSAASVKKLGAQVAELRGALRKHHHRDQPSKAQQQ